MENLKEMFEPDRGFWLASVGTYVVSASVFWVVGTLFVLADMTGKPAFMKNFKVQPGKNQPIKLGPLWNTTKVIIFNQLAIGFPMSVLNAGLLRLRGCDFTLTLPETVEFLRDFAIFAVLEEFGFYYSHRSQCFGSVLVANVSYLQDSIGSFRLLHHPIFYSWIHKQHHEWTAPFSYVALYAHPIEYIFSNLVPLLLGPLVCGSRIVTTWTWFAVATFTTMIHHSGYHLPLLTSSEFHDFHHLRYSVNYGVTGLLDWFHGTDMKFRVAPQYKRHRVLFSAEDMILPDTKKT